MVAGQLIYHHFEHTARGRMRRSLGDNFGLLEGRKIIDVGCSYGHTTNDLARTFEESVVTGVDIDHRRISQAQENYPSLDFKIADGYHLPDYFPTTKFDTVVMMANLYIVSDLMSDSSLQRIFNRVNLVMFEGGKFCLGADSSYVLFEKKAKLFVPMRRNSLLRRHISRNDRLSCIAGGL